MDEDACQSQKQLSIKLGVAHQTIPERLHAMGKILNEGIWMPHELNERQMENRKVISGILLQQHERKSFLHRILTEDEK